MTSINRISLSHCCRSLLLAACCVTPAAVMAAGLDGATLVQERNCYGCHHQTDALIGPPYSAIAARHASRKDLMVDVLARKIIEGGAGNWGVVPMVPSEQVSEDEAKVIARWILDLGR